MNPFDTETDIEKDIFDTVVDNAEAKVEAKKLLPPEGWWTTEAPLVLTPKTNDEGRRVARYFGVVINNKNPEITAKQGFGLSPDLKYKDGTDTADFNYRMFLSARKAFIEATGAEPLKANDVVRYVAEYPVQLRIIHTPDEEAMVVAIRAVKE